jgi:hypothetical protein
MVIPYSTTHEDRGLVLWHHVLRFRQERRALWGCARS